MPCPIVLPLLGAALSILVGRSRTAQRVIGVAVLTDGRSVVSIVLLVEVDRDGIVVGPGRRLAGAASASPSSPTGSSALMLVRRRR